MLGKCDVNRVEGGCVGSVANDVCIIYTCSPAGSASRDNLDSRVVHQTIKNGVYFFVERDRACWLGKHR